MSLFNLFTIGYSGFAIEDFIAVLKKNSIGALVDIRSSPIVHILKTMILQI